MKISKSKIAASKDYYTDADYKDVESSETIQTEQDDFDKRWEEKFGESSTMVYDVDEFKAWLDEVMDFE